MYILHVSVTVQTRALCRDTYNNYADARGGKTISSEEGPQP